MGKKLILSENEKLYIQSLYKDLLGEQNKEYRVGITPEPNTKPEPINPRKYLPIAEEFCEILNGKGQLKKGAKGELVKLFQEALIKCFKPPLQNPLPKYGADGNFGDETKDAVEEFQNNHKLKVDGGIGKQTAGKLCELGCIPKEICGKCVGQDSEQPEQTEMPGGTIIRDRIGVDCEKVQGCIDKFLGQVREEICVDEDKIRGLLKCVGIGQCFEGGEVSRPQPIRSELIEGCLKDGVNLCSIPYKELGKGNYIAQVGYFYDPKNNECVARSMGGGPFSQEEKCVQCCVRK
jgi:hypothetical protein